VGQCASGTVTAELSNDPGFVGLYKYCLSLDWSLSQFALSHPDLFIGLEDCECVCDPSVVQFGDPAGHSTSSEDGESCDNDYYGEYVCMGDPSLPAAMNGPAVKWEPYPASCEPGTEGSGTFCFYSPLPPGDAMTHSNAIAIKHGQETCYGDVQGVLPQCDCTVEGHHTHFGQLKSFFGEAHPQH
jgi:hypothetical protein